MEVRFSLDGSLGRLARWLRLLGGDAAGRPADSLRAALRRARAEERVLLTRSADLERFGGTPPRAGWLRIVADDLPAQLLQVDRRWPVLDRADPLRRCALCNRSTEELPADRARPRVPPFVARTQERYRICPACGRIYWEATHATAIARFVRELRSRRDPAARTGGNGDEEDAGPDLSSPAP
ncbi:MAG: hypothetical protein GF346_06835 [Candidatus Eisenbacteria bacterium]|nr:hypothetical protein [Candidatus Latescibacterota bacterium]MBD3302144.1 hypothetical protein [Candidatus Eisenbacteria bacterium]